MNDLTHQLGRLAELEDLPPLDVSGARTVGRRHVRRRRAAAIAGVAAAVTVGSLAVSTYGGQAAPDIVEFGDTGDRRPAASPIPPEQAYADLVTARRGKEWVSIKGFGWPLAGMSAVSAPDGTVELGDISRLDGESMCLPMLEAAAPEVPAEAWRHTPSWVDTFPSRATLPMTVEAEHDGRHYMATCSLPGDDVPVRRPDLEVVPGVGDDVGIREQCSYLGHVDFSGWEVVAAAAAPRSTIAALRSADGLVTTCVLSDRPSARVVQLSATSGPPVVDDQLVAHVAGGEVAVAGRAPDAAAKVVLQTSGDTISGDVVDGAFAVAGAGAARRVEFLDEDGGLVARFREGQLMDSICFYTVETGGDGC